MDCISSFQDNIISTREVSFNFDISGGVGTVYYKKMKAFSNKIAQIDAKTGKSDTYETLLQKSIRTAIELKARGVKKGDHISLCSDHHLNAPVPLIAAYMIGAVPFPIEPTLEVPDITHLVAQITPKVIFTISSVRHKIEKALSTVGIKPDIVVFDDFENAFLNQKNGEDVFVPYYAEDLKETATIYFSSGSTGLPKGICINHYTIMGYCTPAMEKAADNNSVYNSANWYWVSSGMIMFLTTVLGGCRIVGSFNPNEFWYWIDKYATTKVYLSGFDFVELAISKKPVAINTSSMKTIVVGGSPTATEYLKQMKKLFPSANVFQCYGMTEIGYVTLYDTNNELHEKMAADKCQSIGMPVDGVSYKVVNTETGQTVGQNQRGQLLIKSDKLMNGYYNMDTSDRYDEEGWFKTGDVVYYDRDFCFYFVNRIKDALSYRGWWIYPSKLENILMSHPAVKVAVVVGKPHKIDEELITAVVILNEGYKDRRTPKELEKYLHDRVQDERQHIRGGVYILKQMPVTVTGKINRNRVKQMVVNNDQAVY